MLEVLKKTPILRVICFLLILVGLVIPVQKAILYRDRKTDNSSYQVMNFYKEKEDSLNPVFIGSSCCLPTIPTALQQTIMLLRAWE